MPHTLAGAFQKAFRISNLGTTKEPDIDVIFEGIDVAECRITYTGGRSVIMQQLSNIVPAVAHDFKPLLRDRPQFTGMLMHPELDCKISLGRSGKPHELIHLHDDFDG